jgi:hypothetical protein
MNPDDDTPLTPKPEETDETNPSSAHQGAREEDVDRSLRVPSPDATPTDLEGDAVGSADTPG